MTDVSTPSISQLDLQIPSIVSRVDGGIRPTPARVPELELDTSGACRPRDGAIVSAPVLRVPLGALVPPRVPVGSATRERDLLRRELADLKSQVPSLRHERDELRMELAELRREVPPLRRQRDELHDEMPSLQYRRDELLATAALLSDVVADLDSQHDEVLALRSEIQELRGRKSSIEKTLDGLGRPVESIRRNRRSGKQTFHDS